jgi:hypothetical protein
VSKLHVLSGQAQFDERRNTSRVFASDPENTRQVLAMIARARTRGEHWVTWIDSGCPELTPEEYKRVSTFKRKRCG